MTSLSTYTVKTKINLPLIIKNSCFMTELSLMLLKKKKKRVV